VGSSQFVSASGSQSQAPAVDDSACDSNECAEDIGAECVAHSNSTYYCDCSAVVPDTNSSNLVAGGKTCDEVINTMASVSDDNCAECESVFIGNVDPAEVSGDGTDYATVEEYILALPEILAALTCGCADPSKELIAQFSVVQSVAGPDGAWSVEITILPVADNNPEADTPADVLERLETNSKDEDARKDAGATSGFTVSSNRPTDLRVVDDEEEGGSDFPLVLVLLGILGFFVLLVAVYALRRHIQKRYALQSMGDGSASVVKMGADGSVTVHKMKMETDTASADSKENRSRSIDNEITPPVDRERRPTVLPDINDLDNLNEIHVPGSAGRAEEDC
jgi:hypothetical protein